MNLTEQIQKKVRDLAAKKVKEKLHPILTLMQQFIEENPDCRGVAKEFTEKATLALLPKATADAEKEILAQLETLTT